MAFHDRNDSRDLNFAGEPVRTPDNGGSTEPVISKPGPAADPFNPERFRLNTDYLVTGATTRRLLTVRVGKPAATEWFALWAEAEYQLDTYVLEDKVAGQFYIIEPGLHAELADISIVTLRRLFVGINRAGALFVWPVRLPSLDGRDNSWFTTAYAAAVAATCGWIRMEAVRGGTGYAIYEPKATLAAPEWPTLAMAEILRLGFGQHVITSLDHIILRQLRGEI